jgi:hypothetical protein
MCIGEAVNWRTSLAGTWSIVLAWRLGGQPLAVAIFIAAGLAGALATVLHRPQAMHVPGT